jgi:signal transduction histidine kinase
MSAIPPVYNQQNTMSALADLTTRVSTRHWKILTLAMLVLLHLAAVRGVQDFWARGFLLMHFGLFIVWQPFLQGSQRLHWSELVAIVGVSALVLLGLNWWLVGLWVAMLAGVVGGKVFINQRRGPRAFYLLMLAYLIGLLLVWLVPNGLPEAGIDPEVRDIVQWILLGLFVVMAFIPVRVDVAEPQVIDLVYATLIFLLLVVLVLGGFAFVTVGHVSYALGLIYALATLAVMLIFMSVVWNPRAGFGGLSILFSRYLLSVGLPFEQWLHFLAELSRTELEPQRFLAKACAGLRDLQWIMGGVWRAGGEQGQFGERGPHSVDFSAAELSMQVYSRLRPSPALVWHFHVLGRLLLQFYLAKQREVKLRQQSYVQAVHETGARLTHDVKNLLQSLNTLTSAAAQEGGDPIAFQAMVRRNLPTVTQRLQATLDKLQRPPTVETGRFVRADAWWDTVMRSYNHPGLTFETDIKSPPPGPLPKDLFETAADNLINNALEKNKLDPTVRVTAALHCDGQVRFSVTDTGKPVPRDVERGLFMGPVPSDTGYGIGLYQVYRQAEAAGYVLELASNEPGQVVFQLRSVEPRRGD